MIDFKDIKFTEQKLGTFGHIELKAGLKIESRIEIDPNSKFNNPKRIDSAKEELKLEIYHKIYGDLIPPFQYLRDIIYSYVLPNMGYSQHPWFVNEKELKENLEKLENLLKKPE